MKTKKDQKMNRRDFITTSATAGIILALPAMSNAVLASPEDNLPSIIPGAPNVTVTVIDYRILDPHERYIEGTAIFYHDEDGNYTENKNKAVAYNSPAFQRGIMAHILDLVNCGTPLRQIRICIATKSHPRGYGLIGGSGEIIPSLDSSRRSWMDWSGNERN